MYICGIDKVNLVHCFLDPEQKISALPRESELNIHDLRLSRWQPKIMTTKGLIHMIRGKET